MSSWPFTFEAESELEEELRRRSRWRRPWPARRPRPRVRLYRRPAIYPAPYVTEPVYVEPPPPEVPPEPVEEPVEDEPQEEIHISTGCTAVLQKAAAVNAGDVYDDTDTLPSTPGLYLIHTDTKAIYVGMAEKSIHSRFQQRYKVLRDFGLGPAALTGIKVTSYSLDTRSATCTAGRKKKRNTSLTNISPIEGILRVLEQHFIKHFKTQRPPRGKFGNAGFEGYTSGRGVSLTVSITGGSPSDPPSKVI